MTTDDDLRTSPRDVPVREDDGVDQRPAPPNEAPAGYAWVAVQEDGRWQPLGAAGSPHAAGLRCRLMTARHQCGKPAVARLNRATGRSPQWWAYCAEHLFGRWVEDGAVMGWRLRSEED